MTTELLQHRLTCLGWRPLNDGQQAEVYGMCSPQCRHIIFAVADSHQEAWSAVCSMAMKLTREEILRLPRP